ncbi:MAG: hypothetical protein ACR2PF_08390, partial [Rhizobiaceae bacterium]
MRLSGSATSRLGKVCSRAVDLATIESNTPAYSSISLLADLFPDYFLLISHELPQRRPFPEAIRTIEDLRGRRIAIPEAATVGNLSFWSTIDHYKL